MDLIREYKLRAKRFSAALFDQKVEDRFCVLGSVDFVAEGRVVHNSGDLGECLNMLACARGWTRQEHDQLHRLRVHGLEVHRGRWATDREGRALDAIALSMGDRESMTNPGCPSLFARPDRVLETIWVFDFLVYSKKIDQFIDRALLFSSGERGLDTFDAED